MSDARHDQKVIDSIASTEAFESLARSCGMDKETFLREWNKGSAYADKRMKWEKDFATGARDDGAINGYGSNK